MGNVFIFVKKYWLFFLIVLAFILFITSKFLEKTSQAPTSPSPATKKIASFGEISPGNTSIDKVNELLGFPVDTNKVDGKDVYDYETNNKYIHHKVIVENGIAKLVKEAVNIEDNKNADTIRGVYGLAPYVLYEQEPNSVFNLYVYPENGITYLGHEDGTLLEIWYFEPTTIDSFISLWAQNFSQKEFEGQSRY